MAEKVVVRKRKKSVHDTIPFMDFYRESGIFETEPGVFSRAYELGDFNFIKATVEEQEKYVERFGDLLNSFDKNVHFQMLTMSVPADKTATFRDIALKKRRDGKDHLRLDINGIMVDKFSKARNSIVQKKYLIVSMTDSSYSHVLSRCDTLDKDVERLVRNISRDISVHVVRAEERLKMLYGIYNPDDAASFYNDIDKNGTRFFSLKTLSKHGLTAKDHIAPDSFAFKLDRMRIGKTYVRSFFLSDIPSTMSTDFMTELTSIPTRMNISVIYVPIERSDALHMVKKRLDAVNLNITSIQETNVKTGVGFGTMPNSLVSEQEADIALLEGMKKKENAFYVYFTVALYADSEEQLEVFTRELKSIGRSYAPFKAPVSLQETVFNTTLPFCDINGLKKNHFLSTSSASVFFPFTAQELREKDGFFYGINELTNNIIVYNRLRGENHNSLIFGSSGSGKSFFTKLEILNAYLSNPSYKIYIIDPEGEYEKLCHGLGGLHIDLSSKGTNYINPLDMNLDYDGESDPVAMKVDYILGMMEIMVNDKRYGLNQTSKSVITRCVHNVYKHYCAEIDSRREDGLDVTCDREIAPVLRDLYEELKKQKEPEGQAMAIRLEPYIGSDMPVFSNRTNVDTDNRLVVYDILHLGTGHKELALYICLNNIWNEMVENRKKDIYSFVYIDEFSVLLSSRTAVEFISQFWRRARKWNGAMTGITQTTDDLVNTSEQLSIIKNTSLTAFFHMEPLEARSVRDVYQIDDESLEYLQNAEKGHGLLCTGSNRVEFNNLIPKDNAVYKLISTSETQDKIFN